MRPRELSLAVISVHRRSDNNQDTRLHAHISRRTLEETKELLSSDKVKK